MFDQAIEKLNFNAILTRIQRYCHSSLGNERVRQCRPSQSLSDIQRAHTLLNEMKAVLEGDDPIPIENIYDVRTDVHRAGIEGNILQGKQLLQIGLTANTSRRLREYIKKRHEKYPHLSLLSEDLISDLVLEHHIFGVINEDGEVRDDASPDLQKIRKSIRSISEHLRRRLERILKVLSHEGMAQEEIITTREGRMVIPVKVEFKHRVPGFIHSSSASGATVFIEPAETLDINNDLRDHHIQEQREIHRILRSMTEKIAEKKDPLLKTLNTLAEFDFLCAKAQYSIESIGTSPRHSSSQTIRLVNARHPILLHHHRRDDVVPLSLTIGDSYQTLIITGPNAGGKSVAMQTVGLMSLMYQSGLHIPASPETELPIFQKIFVIMGDEQSIEHDLSTFSSHLIALNRIINGADSSSLVLIDEIGAGTDPVEGSAIAASVLEHLADRGAITIATTHHGDLKAFAYGHPRIKNGAMEFDQEHLTPTYRFTPGIPGSSYALEIAQRLNFPEDLLKKARTFLGESQSKIEHLLVELEQQSQRLKKELDIVSAEKQRLERLTLEYEQKLDSLQREMKRLKREAAEEAKRIVDRANAIIENAVREIRESAADRHITQKWRAEVQSFREELDQYHSESQEKPKGADEPDSSLSVGDRVVLSEGGEEGEVLTAVDAEGYTHVLFGSVKMRVHRDQLRKGSKQHKPTRERSYADGTFSDTFYPRKVDIRGLTGDEAESAVATFLDRALLSGHRIVEIIHGKGTGALRKRISEYLRRHPDVEHFRLGDWNEGGSGVTIVELKLK